MSDNISRQAAIDALADYIHNVDRVIGTGHLSADDCKDAAISVLADLPSADRPQGEWIKNDLGTVICSECKRPRRDNRVNHINFCNSCGARMRPKLQGKHFDSIIIDESAMKGADDE